MEKKIRPVFACQYKWHPNGEHVGNKEFDLLKEHIEFDYGTEMSEIYEDYPYIRTISVPCNMHETIFDYGRNLLYYDPHILISWLDYYGNMVNHDHLEVAQAILPYRKDALNYGKRVITTDEQKEIDAYMKAMSEYFGEKVYSMYQAIDNGCFFIRPRGLDYKITLNMIKEFVYESGNGPFEKIYEAGYDGKRRENRVILSKKIR